MKYLKLFEDFKQLNIPFNEFNVDFDIYTFVKYLEMLNFRVKLSVNEILRTSEGMTSQSIYNILPDEKYIISFFFRIQFDDNDWDEEVYKLIKNFIKDEYNDKFFIKVRRVYKNQVEFDIISKNKIQLSLEDWTKYFIKDKYEIKDNKLYGFVNFQDLVDIFKISDTLATYFTNGDLDIDSIYTYQLEDLEQTLEYLDNDTYQLLLNKLKEKYKIKEINIEDYEDDDLLKDIVNTYTTMCYDISNDKAIDEIYSRMKESLKEYPYEFEILDRVFENNYFYYKFLFKKSWMEDLIREDNHFSVNDTLFSIYKEWFLNYFNKIEINTDYLPSFTNYLNKEQSKNYNSEVKNLIIHY